MDLTRTPRHELRRRLKAGWERRRGALAARAGLPVRAAPVTVPGPRQRLRRDLFEQILRDVEARGAAGLKEKAQSGERVRRVLDQALAAPGAPTLRRRERERIETQLLAELDGLGPLEPLLADPTISDVLVNGPHQVWVDRFGRLERSTARFDDDAHLRRLHDRLVAAQGRHLDEASPYVDVRMADGSRLNALIPPLCEKGAVVSIRRTRSSPFRMAQLVACGTLSQAMASFLEAAVQGGLNIVISGGTGSGKTTLLNVLAGFIPPAERVITIEEIAELRFEHPHLLNLEAQPPNIEGRGEVSLRDLVRNALRMRADRLILGEVRGSEVFDMLQAMNTGHGGSLTTVHANSSRDTLRRLESLVLLAGFDLPSRAIREMLGAAFDLVVHIARFRDGSRRITGVEEVTLGALGSAEENLLLSRELFRFERQRPQEADSATARVRGRHVATGWRPGFLERLPEPAATLEELLDPPGDGAS